MPSGIAIGSIRLTGSSNTSYAFFRPTPLSPILGVDDPFFAVKNLNPVTSTISNPSCNYEFTFRFRVPATASSAATLRDGVWCPNLVLHGVASSSANLVSFSENFYSGRAFFSDQLISESEGSVTVFAQVSGDAVLTPSANGEVNVFAAASGSMLLISSAESDTNVPAVADSLGPLVGNALATTIVNAIAEGNAILEGEAEASVDVFAVAESDMELTGESDANITLVPGVAGATLELEGISEASVSIDASAGGILTLEGDSDGIITLLRATSEGSLLLTGDSNGVLSLIPASASSSFLLISNVSGDLSLIPAESNDSASLSSFSNGEVVVPPALNEFDWEEAFDTSQFSISGNGLGPSGANIPNVGDPAFSATATTASFSPRTSSGSSVPPGFNWNTVLNASTAGLSPSGIGPSRVNGACVIGNGTNTLSRFELVDGSDSGGLVVGRAPFHFRSISRINSGETFEFLATSIINSFSGPKYGILVRYDGANNEVDVFLNTVYNSSGNPLIANISQSFSFNITGSQWVLMDVILRQNGSFPQLEILINGTQSILDTTDTRYTWSNDVSVQGRSSRNSGATDALLLFFGYRTGINYTLAEHNQLVTDLGI